MGGAIIHAKTPIHGRISEIKHNGSRLFFGIPNKFSVARYHSLIVSNDNLPSEICITATSQEGEIMGLEIKDQKLFGVQFHPESFMSEYGKNIIQNFIEINL